MHSFSSGYSTLSDLFYQFLGEYKENEEMNKNSKSFVLFFLLTSGKNTSQFQITEKIILQVKTKCSLFFLQETYTGGSNLFSALHSQIKIHLIWNSYLPAVMVT